MAVSVQKASEQFAGRGVAVVGVHSSGIDRDRLASFIEAIGDLLSAEKP